jgi:pyruvate dehydrogenase E1 component alpha subunit
LERLRAFHTTVSSLRAFEEAVGESLRARDLEGLLHLSIGGEAVVVGVTSQLEADDLVYSSHRPHGHFLAAGADPRAVAAELAGRETGLCRGRGGSLHLMSDRAVMATGIVGGTLPLAVGHALRQPEGSVVVVFFGDGAVQTGTFHESMNLAALWRVPVLFVCENNGVAEFSTRDEHTTVEKVTDYGHLYGLPASEVDGGDVEAVARTVASLLPAIRNGHGPALLEAHVTRLRPHYEGDWREREEHVDFLVGLEARLVELGASADELATRRAADLEAARSLFRSVLHEDPLPDPADDRSLVFARPLP